MIITQNGKAEAVIQDVVSFEETQETLALLKILALGNQQVARGELKPIGAVIARLPTGLTATDEPRTRRHRCRAGCPVHEARLARSYSFSTSAMTRSAWEKTRGQNSNPSFDIGPSHARNFGAVS